MGLNLLTLSHEDSRGRRGSLASGSQGRAWLPRESLGCVLPSPGAKTLKRGCPACPSKSCSLCPWAFFFANFHAIVCLFQEAAAPCVRSRDGHAPGPSERAGVPTAGSTATSKEPWLSLPSQATQEQGRVAVGREQEKGEQCVQQVHSFWLPLSRWPVSARVGQELVRVPVAWK